MGMKPSATLAYGFMLDFDTLDGFFTEDDEQEYGDAAEKFEFTILAEYEGIGISPIGSYESDFVVVHSKEYSTYGWNAVTANVKELEEHRKDELLEIQKKLGVEGSVDWKLFACVG